MRTYVLSFATEKDIEDIVTYIGQDNPIAALKLLDAFYEAMDRLAEHPKIGHYRPDLTPQPVRFWPVRNRYLIIYKESSPLEIIRLLSSYRDITNLLF